MNNLIAPSSPLLAKRADIHSAPTQFSDPSQSTVNGFPVPVEEEDNFASLMAPAIASAEVVQKTLPNDAEPTDQQDDAPETIE